MSGIREKEVVGVFGEAQESAGKERAGKGGKDEHPGHSFVPRDHVEDGSEGKDDGKAREEGTESSGIEGNGYEGTLGKAFEVFVEHGERGFVLEQECEVDFGFGLRDVDFARRLFGLTTLVHLLGGDYGGFEFVEFGFAGSFGTLAAVDELLQGEVGFARVAFGTADREIEGVVGSSAGKRYDVVDGAFACGNPFAAIRTDELLAGADSRFEGLIGR